MATQQNVEAVADAFAREAERLHLAVDGLVIDVDGLEPVQRGWSPDIRRDIFSVSKSVTSMAVGIAASEGRLALDAGVLDLLPMFRDEAAEGVEAVTVRHLLTMTSGIVYRWADPDFDHPGDPAMDILSSPLGFDPGNGFAYRGASPYLLSRIVRATTGLDMRDYLVPRLFAPLGIHNPQWQRCPVGYSIGAVGLELRAEEMSRLTCLLRDDGVFHDRQILPAEYVVAMQRDGRDSAGVEDGEPLIMKASGYGLGVWLWPDESAWFMSGLYGQTGMIVPSRRLAVTVSAHHGGHSDDVHDAIWTSIVDRL